MERWLPVPSTNGLYEASSLGRLRSTVRRYGPTRRYGGCVLRPRVHPATGYEMVTLSVENSIRHGYVHRFVCEAFHGASDLEVNHKSGVKRDNRPENLEWVTRSQNQLHAHANIPRRPQPRSRAVELLLGDGNSFIVSAQTRLARALGVDAASVASAATRGHKCLGYEVRYV